MPMQIYCSSCQTPMWIDHPDPSAWVACPSCQAQQRTEIFPAFFQEQKPGQAGETVLVEGESTCFYHPQKRAVVACESCGRFLCALCDIDLGSGHLCSSCIESGRKKGKLQNLENHRVLYDSLAIRLALLPMIVFYVTAITAPATLYVAIRYWNKPRSIVPRTRVRFYIAILVATLQLIGWGFAVVAILHVAKL